MDENCTDRSFFYSKILKKKFGLNSLTRSKIIALLIFIKFTRDAMDVCHLVHYSRQEKSKKKLYHDFKKFYF
jgi:hypothetical protein